MKISPSSGSAIRQKANHLRNILQNDSAGWQNYEEPRTGSYKPGTSTTHFWKVNQEGDELLGSVTHDQEGLDRFTLVHEDTSEGLESLTRYTMITTKPTASTAPIGSWLMQTGFGLALTPMVSPLGTAMISAGRWMSFKNSEPDIEIFRKRSDGNSEFAMFDANGQFIGDEPSLAQKLLFS